MLKDKNKFLIDLIENYKEKKKILKRKQLDYEKEKNIWTRNDLDSEINFYNVEVRSLACQIVDDILLLDLAWERILEYGGSDLLKKKKQLKQEKHSTRYEYTDEDGIEREKEDKPHCIGCKNSKAGVCRKHTTIRARFKPLLSTKEGMAEYKKIWRAKQKRKGSKR